jgi:glutathione S-transferase
MMRLFHSTHSTCSQKVRLCLAEKGLNWQSVHLNLRQFDQVQPEFLAINPAGLVPVLEDRGTVILESRIINEYLEDAYPDVALLPASARERVRIRTLTRHIDVVVSEAIKLPSFAKNIQPTLQSENRETVLSQIERIPDPAIRARWRMAATGALHPADFEDALVILRDWLDELDDTLARHPWLSGGRIGLADVDAAPFIQRLMRIDMGADVQARPHVLAWFTHYSQTPAFLAAMPVLGSESQVPIIS